MENIEENEIHLRDYFRVIRKRRKLIILFAVITIVSVVLGTMAVTPLYQADVNVLIERNYDTSLDAKWWGQTYDPEFMETQFTIIKSRNVIDRVVRTLKLDIDYRQLFFKDDTKGSLFQTITSYVKSLTTPITSLIKTSKHLKVAPVNKLPIDQQESRSDAQIIADIIQSRISTQPIKNSRIVEISYLNEHPGLASLITNSIADAYAAEMLEIKMNTTNYAIQWMTSKAEDEKQKLEASERALQDYITANDLVTVEDKMAITPQKLAQFSSEQSTAQTKRSDVENLYNQIQKARGNMGILEAIPQFASDRGLQNVREKMLMAEQQVTELSKKYGEKHPLMKKAVGEVSALKGKKSDEINRLIDSVRIDYELAQEKEQNLQDLVTDTKQELLTQKERYIQYDVLKREVETNRSLYNALISKVKEQGATEQTQSVNIWVIKKATTPSSPAKPDPGRNLLLAVILGVFGGVGIAFFVEYLDNTVKSVEEVERQTGLHVLGVITQQEKNIDINTALRDESRSLIAESYRSIRSQVLLSSAGNPPKCILVTSGMPQEGKTTTALNLARILSQSESSVLLVDCDMRKPRIHKVFGLSNKFGLSNYLTSTGQAAPIQKAADEKLDIIPSGPVPPNPSELLASTNMRQLLEEMSVRYDFIIIDSPPVMSVTDSQILSRLVDGTIIVTKGGDTTWDELKRAVRLFADVKAHMLGIVLNAVKIKDSNDAYYYQGYYNYYGSYSEKTDKKA
ncbi:MAG: polysaccharide biosynthesis tyrosine autokinase [Proteobacteria bacterium]|nr:polysaccharide biosynthesis tyrosine autokinase [Desulfobulbaceae bacterium]MBU4154457.1 polysaccharide biosynthesis tyrosine autokinase [Pseudomonadota bacterium]